MQIWQFNFFNLNIIKWSSPAWEESAIPSSWNMWAISDSLTSRKAPGTHLPAMASWLAMAGWLAARTALPYHGRRLRCAKTVDEYADVDPRGSLWNRMWHVCLIKRRARPPWRGTRRLRYGTRNWSREPGQGVYRVWVPDKISKDKISNDKISNRKISMWQNIECKISTS